MASGGLRKKKKKDLLKFLSVGGLSLWLAHMMTMRPSIC